MRLTVNDDDDGDGDDAQEWTTIKLLQTHFMLLPFVLQLFK